MFQIGFISLTIIYPSSFQCKLNRSNSPLLSYNVSPMTYILPNLLWTLVHQTDSVDTISLLYSRRHQSDGNEIAHARLRASTRDLRASPKPTSKSTIEEDLKKLIDLESPTPESQKNFKVQDRAWGK